MPYPMVKGKHLGKALFSPYDLIEYKRKIRALPRVNLPESIIFCYSPRLASQFEESGESKEVRGVLGNVGRLSILRGTNGKVGMLSRFGIGAPTTVMHMEELIPYGTRRFVILGMAGGISRDLKIGDVVVSTKSVRDEGTSHHYVKPGKYAYPAKRLTEDIFRTLSSDFKRLYKGPSWTIDAPYRETVKEIRRYRSEGVLTVEMEASALFAAGEIRGVETSAVFVISDILSDRKWNPKFRSKIVFENLIEVFKFTKQILAT